MLEKCEDWAISSQDPKAKATGKVQRLGESRTPKWVEMGSSSKLTTVNLLRFTVVNMKQYKDTPYFITEDGSVFRIGKQFPLKPDVSPKGYCRVTLCIDDKTQRFLVHRLVAEVFIPNPNGCGYVNHIDNNPMNNSKDNLEWVTHSQNMIHSHVQGRCSNLLASNKASESKFQESEKVFKALLGSNFVELINENPRNFVVFKCECCGSVQKSRTDSTVFSRSSFTCRSCSKKMKI